MPQIRESGGGDDVTRTTIPNETRTTVHHVAETTPVMAMGNQDAFLRRDRVRWGPIAAGLATTIAVLFVLMLLGLAIGLSAFEPNASGASDIGTSAAIWGAASALVAFLLGGWVAAKSSAVDGNASGALNGFLVGAAALVLMIWLIGIGLGNLFGAVSNNIGDIVDLGNESAVTVPNGTDVNTVATDNYDEARNSAWGTLAGVVLALAAATLGGWMGHNERSEVVGTAGAPAAGGTGVSRNRSHA